MRRQVKLYYEMYIVFLVDYDQNNTTKIFKYHLKALELQLPAIANAVKAKINHEYSKTRRLKHNIVTHASKIQQELWKIIPQEQLAGLSGKEKIKYIKSTLQNKLDPLAYSYLRLIKYSNFIKAEFDTYDLLNSRTPFLDFSVHSIYKIIQLSASVYWLDFAEKDVLVELSENHDTVYIDYKSISVAISHIFDNAVKYSLPKSSISVNFRKEIGQIVIEIKMISLKINDDECNGLFLNNLSGEWAKRLMLAGDGLGMNIAQTLFKLNGGLLKVKNNVSPTLNRNQNGIPYEANVFEIYLPSIKSQN